MLPGHGSTATSGTSPAPCELCLGTLGTLGTVGTLGTLARPLPRGVLQDSHEEPCTWGDTMPLVVTCQATGAPHGLTREQQTSAAGSGAGAKLPLCPAPCVSRLGCNEGSWGQEGKGWGDLGRAALACHRVRG